MDQEEETMKLWWEERLQIFELEWDGSWYWGRIYVKLYPENKVMPVYDAVEYKKGTDLVVLEAKNMELVPQELGAKRH